MRQSDHLNDLERKIRLRRSICDLSQIELARRIRKSQQLVSAIEHGKVDVSYSNLIAVSRALDCSLSTLLRN